MTDWVGKRLGQYEIVEVIGRGGMATVYRARQASLGRDVAIKVLTGTAARDPGFIARFEREASIIARLEHAHILPIYDYGHDEGQSYLVMRYLDGGSLYGRIVQKQVRLAEVSRLAPQIAAALDYAHGVGIVHRDLKPHNVLLDRQGDGFLCDFGIAKLLTGESSLTKDGIAIGTPSYMAPEQWRGDPVDARTDVYALGVMLFEMLTGQAPFHSENVISLMYKQLNEPAPPASQFRPDLPPAMDVTLLRAMAKDPEDRFLTAGALVDEFLDVLHGRPAPAARTGAEAPLAPPTARLAKTSDTAPTDVFSVSVNLPPDQFTGRAWVLEDLERWRLATLDGESDESSIFYLVGPHGIGKSELARRFAERLTGRVLHYALLATQARTLDPRLFVESLAAQVVHLASPGDTEEAEVALVSTPAHALADSLEAFESRVLEPISRESEPVYLIIDGLDAAFEHPGTTIVGLLESAIANWPMPLRLIVTAAPDARLESVFRGAERLELNPESSENRADLRGTLSMRFATLVPNLSKGEIDLLALEEKAHGNPLYLNLVFESLAYKRIRLTDLPGLPAGLDALYADLTRRADQADPANAALLRILAVAREPLPDKLLAEIADERVEPIQNRLSDLRPLARYVEGGWELSHQALRHWLSDTDAPGIVEAHQRIAEALSHPLPAQMEHYALEHLPAHFLAGQKSERAQALLTDLNFLEAKLLHTWLGEVVDDFDLVQASLSAARLAGTSAGGALTQAIGVVRNAIREAAEPLNNDPANAFSILYNRLAGVEMLAEPLKAAAARRKGLWLRLDWPIRRVPVSTEQPDQIVWHGAPPIAVAATESRWLAAHGDGQLRLWEGSELVRAWLGHKRLENTETSYESLTGCALSADGRFGLSASESGAARVWDLESGASLGLLAGHARAITGCDLSADGKWALTASEDRLLLLWDVATGKILQNFYQHPDRVTCCAFIHDGDRSLALSGCTDGSLRVWSLPDGELLHTLSGHRGAVTACAGSEPGATPGVAVSGSTDGVVRVWGLRGGNLLHMLRGHTAAIKAVTLGTHNDQPVVIAASEDRTLRVWRLSDGQPVARLEGHAEAVVCCAFGADGRILSGSLDGTLRVWEIRGVESGQASQIVETHGAEVTGCSFSGEAQGAQRLLTGSLDREVRLWDAATGRVLQAFRGHTGGVTGCALRSDGRVALSASSDKSLRLWDVGRGTMLKLLTGHADAVLCCAFSHKPIKLPGLATATWLAASGGRDRMVRVWDTEGGKLLLTLKGHGAEVVSCAFSPAEPLLASASKDGTARLWSLAEQSAVAKFSDENAAYTDCEFSPDGKLLILGLEDGRLLLLDRASGGTETLAEASGGRIGDCGFSTHGQIVFAVSADGMARLWDVRSRQVIASFNAAKPLASGAMASDNITLAVGDSKGGVYLLKIEGQTGPRRRTQPIPKA